MARMGRPAMYPWDEWLDGEVHVLQPGVHFRVSDYSMRRQILLEARKRQIPIETEVRNGWIQIKPSMKDPERKAGIDWDAVFRKDVAVLEQGTDFTGTLESMVSGARHAAKRRGLRCSIEVGYDTLTIRSYRIMSVPATETAPAGEGLTDG